MYFVVCLPLLLPAAALQGPAFLTHDFGAASLDTPVRHTFVLDSPTDTPLRVLSVRPSSSSLVVLSYRQYIPANTSGEIEVCLLPDRAGEVRYNLNVNCEPPGPSNVTYTLKGRITYSDSRADETGLFPDTISRDLITRAIEPSDSACYVSACEIIGRSASSEAPTIVDTRPPSDFQAARIPGSINIPVFAVKTKTFLKDRQVVIVDDGYGDPVSERTYRDLRSSGFECVHILRNGLNGWNAAGGRFEGTTASSYESSSISTADFHRVRNNADWLLVDIDPHRDPSAELLLPGSMLIPLSSDREEFLDAIERLRVGSDRSPYILLFDRTGQSYDSFPELREMANVFTLTGGLDAYKMHLAMLTASQNRHTVLVSSTPAPQRTSAGRSSPRRRRSGCGGCR